MSAGNGYRYLLKSVAVGDGDRALSTPLTRYYAQVGNPSGWWLGGGLAAFGEGGPAVGEEVGESQLQLLIGQGRHPGTGDPLGRPYRTFAPVSARVDARMAALDPLLPADARDAAVEQIAAEEAARGGRRAVAGFDLTFSVPKSASVLWAVADATIQAAIVAAHHRAVENVVQFLEREVAATRVGGSDGHGGAAQMDVAGVIATAFDHFDSRAGDPHLHTHVVISNKVPTGFDGKWRALDGRPLHQAVVALSELHEALFADELTRTLGVTWEMRARGRDRAPSWDIRGVPSALTALFSSRSKEIDRETDELITDYVESHGRRPGPAVIMKIRAQATLSTRPAKHVRSLAELTARWRTQASAVLLEDADRWARTVVADRAPALLRAGDLDAAAVAAMGERVVDAVGEKRSTWRHWNLVAEAARQTMGLRFATPEDREAVVGRVVLDAERVSLRLTPSELGSTPVLFQRPDGSSRFRPRHSSVYSSQRILDAEDRLLALARDVSAPIAPPQRARSVTRALGADHAVALSSVVSSGRVVDVLVGPAGSGKSTAMRALRQIWEAEHGAGSVTGLAPSAAAAAVLGTELGIDTENTAKWLHDHAIGGLGFGSGQLVIVDEASLAGTVSLDRIATVAATSGAKLLLVGDTAQLQAVEAGGAFALLVSDRTDPPTLRAVHRFTAPWEKTASLRLRDGDPAVIDTYAGHDRLIGGDTDAVIAQAYAAWRGDIAARRASVLIAETANTVRELNLRARADRILTGDVDARRGIALHDGTSVSPGDAVITRHNDRRLRAGKGWVRNGDRWTVTAVRSNGSIAARRTGRRWGGTVVLPAEYVAEHVELGYAVTAHRAQGITVDSAHAVISAASTRESLYVAMTRGRESNIAYVATDRPDDDHGTPPADQPGPTVRSVLTGVLAHVGAERSARETLRAAQEAWTNIGRIAAEYDTIATAAQRDRWVALIRSSGLAPAHVEAAIDSDAFGPLCAAFRRAEAHHHDLAVVVPRIVAGRGFADAADVAAVLEDRLARATARPAGSPRARRPALLIAGILPEAIGPMDAEMRQALDERRALIEQRAAALAVTAIRAREPWTAALGTPPPSPQLAARWQRQVQIIAAYRDRYAITGDRPLGAPADSDAQRRDAARAATALAVAHQCATFAEPSSPHRDRTLDRQVLTR